MWTYTIADILKIGLLLGHFDEKDISVWAEKQISDGNNEELIINLLFAKNKSEIISLLNEKVLTSSGINRELTNEYFLGFYNELLKKTTNEWDKIAKYVLKYFSLNEFVLDDDEKLFVSRLNNDMSLRDEGFAGPMDMPVELIDFLKKHNKFNELQKRLTDEGLPQMSAIVN